MIERRRPHGKERPDAIKEGMGKFILTVLIATLPNWATAQQSDKPQKPPNSVTPRPVKVNPCAAYGPGFVRVEGTDTCIKIGGSVQIDAGGSLRR
jgi:Porin subfamily